MYFVFFEFLGYFVVDLGKENLVVLLVVFRNSLVLSFVCSRCLRCVEKLEGFDWVDECEYNSRNGEGK